MINKKYIIGLLVFWTVALVGFIVSKQYIFQTGTDILLQTIPVDPRDLFRGDYVELQYDISRLDVDTLAYVGPSFLKDETVYVLLDNTKAFAQAVKIARQKFDRGVFIKGVVDRSYGHIIHVHFGIEHYFVEEGSGKEIERQRGRLSIKVTVDKGGNALIKALMKEEMPE